MSEIDQITTFLGWCSALNIGLLLLFTFFLTVSRNFTRRTHSALFHIDEG
jgi:hypothetical protein